jgi:hypothetical protein
LAIAGSFLLQSTDNEVFLTEDGVVNKRLFTDTELVAVTANKHSVIAMTIHGKSRNLIKINTANWSTTTIANGIAGRPVWLASGSILYMPQGAQSNFHLYSTERSQDTKWQLTPSVQSAGNTSLAPVTLLGNTAAIVNDTADHYFLLGNDLHAYPTP